ncbi:unnamed protein product [Arctogadus glacialis]
MSDLFPMKRLSPRRSPWAAASSPWPILYTKDQETGAWTFPMSIPEIRRLVPGHSQCPSWRSEAQCLDIPNVQPGDKCLGIPNVPPRD